MSSQLSGERPRALESRNAISGLTLLFLGLAFRKLYLVPQACVPGTQCADPQTTKRQRLIFWSVAVLLLGLLAVPWFAPLFY